MSVITVTFTIQEEHVRGFAGAMEKQARASLEREAD